MRQWLRLSVPGILATVYVCSGTEVATPAAAQLAPAPAVAPAQLADPEVSPPACEVEITGQVKTGVVSDFRLGQATTGIEIVINENRDLPDFTLRWQLDLAGCQPWPETVKDGWYTVKGVLHFCECREGRDHRVVVRVATLTPCPASVRTPSMAVTLTGTIRTNAKYSVYAPKPSTLIDAESTWILKFDQAPSLKSVVRDGRFVVQGVGTVKQGIDVTYYEVIVSKLTPLPEATSGKKQSQTAGKPGSR